MVSHLLLPLLDGELVLAEDLGGKDLLVGEVAGGVGLGVKVSELGLDGEGREQDGLLGGAVHVLRQDVVLDLKLINHSYEMELLL